MRKYTKEQKDLIIDMIWFGSLGDGKLGDEYSYLLMRDSIVEITNKDCTSGYTIKDIFIIKDSYDEEERKLLNTVRKKYIEYKKLRTK